MNTIMSAVPRTCLVRAENSVVFDLVSAALLRNTQMNPSSFPSRPSTNDLDGDSSWRSEAGGGGRSGADGARSAARRSCGTKPRGGLRLGAAAEQECCESTALRTGRWGTARLRTSRGCRQTTAGRAPGLLGGRRVAAWNGNLELELRRQLRRLGRGECARVLGQTHGSAREEQQLIRESPRLRAGRRGNAARVRRRLWHPHPHDAAPESSLSSSSSPPRSSPWKHQAGGGGDAASRGPVRQGRLSQARLLLEALVGMRRLGAHRCRRCRRCRRGGGSSAAATPEGGLWKYVSRVPRSNSTFWPPGLRR